MCCQTLNKKIIACQKFSVLAFRFHLLFLIPLFTYKTCAAQILDSVKTGNLTNTAEEYWPKPSVSSSFLAKMKHLELNKSRGWVTLGVNLREGHEYFDNYLWGIGEQDPNGFSQHRAIISGDFRWNRHLRFFTEIQSGFISGRRGGARPVQDLNELVINQAFLEATLWKSDKFASAIRIGKQALSYGSGSLLDLRDINVRRNYYGYKLVIKTHHERLDAFYMNPSNARTGMFDDKIDWKDHIAGLWYSHANNATRTLKIKTDFYYLYLHRDNFRYNQAVGNEDRHTVGMLSQLDFGNWTNYLEGDLQAGRFGGAKIRAWKLMESIFYSAKSLPLKPSIGFQSAISSGDNNPTDNKLGTFSPLFPRGIYYGFIDNAGSANLILFHPKCDLELSSKLFLSLSYYRFWRFKRQDALYSTPGSFLFGAENTSRYVGWMGDAVGRYNFNSNLNFSLITSYYKRGDFLLQTPITKGNIFYFGLKANFII